MRLLQIYGSSITRFTYTYFILAYIIYLDFLYSQTT